MRPIDADAIQLPKGFFENVDNVPKFYEWLNSLPTVPAAPRWHRADETPNEDGWYVLGFLSRWKNGTWLFPDFPDYWMPIEPLREIKNE